MYFNSSQMNFQEVVTIYPYFFVIKIYKDQFMYYRN